ncbi:MAG: hypothetical protein H6Q05_1903 [Acidobacteria bacterium]|nr:hypothetical protein [Acidobacteriota bacterium]
MTSGKLRRGAPAGNSPARQRAVGAQPEGRPEGPAHPICFRKLSAAPSALNHAPSPSRPHGRACLPPALRAWSRRDSTVGQPLKAGHTRLKPALKAAWPDVFQLRYTSQICVQSLVDPEGEYHRNKARDADAGSPTPPPAGGLPVIDRNQINRPCHQRGCLFRVSTPITALRLLRPECAVVTVRPIRRKPAHSDRRSSSSHICSEGRRK